MGKRQQREDRALHLFDSGPVALIDDKDVPDFHDAGLEGLNVITHPGNQHDNGDIGELDDIDFVLPDSDGLDENGVSSRRVKNANNVCCGSGEPPQGTARGHASNKDSGIRRKRIHPDAIAEDRTSCEGAAWVYCDDSYLGIVLPVRRGEAVHERAFTRAGTSRYTDGSRVAGVWEKFLEEGRGFP
jgi:hypothetical protein